MPSLDHTRLRRLPAGPRVRAWLRTSGAGRRRLACGLIAAVALACGEEPAPEPPAPETPQTAAAPAPRGMWVLCQGSQRVLDRPERLPALIDDARALGVSDLFVQVYRGGRAWFDSTHADATPWRRNRDAAGEDTLALLLREAHAAGLRVHAWVNVLNLADNREAPVVEALGRDAVLVDQRGRSLLDYPKLDVPPPDRRYYRLGTPGVWLDPAAPGVAEYLVETFRELVVRYPALDGIHLDYIRYPGVIPFAPGSRFGVGLDLGHGAPTRERFRAETGREAPRPPDRLANADRWDAWRRDKVTQLVDAIASATRSARPDLRVSAAVWSHAERAYLSIGQDWRRWLEDGLLDLAVPMAYTLDDRLLRYQAEDFAGAPQSPHIWVGLGSWLFSRRPQGAVEQVAIARAAGVTGDSLFSWDSIADAPELLQALARDAAGERGPAQAEAGASAPSAGDAPDPARDEAREPPQGD